MKAWMVSGLAVLVLLAMAGTAGAIPNYRGEVVGKCVTHNGKTYNVVATVTELTWTNQGLQYVFAPAATAESVTVDLRTMYFYVPPGTYTVTVGNPELQGTYAGVVAGNCRGLVGTPSNDRYTTAYDITGLAAANGMTWAVLDTNKVNGTTRVGCKTGCDPHKGDTPCTTPLPLLCVKKSGAGFPLPPPAGFNNNDSYNKWMGGILATTAPAAAPATLADANKACATAFGTDWRVAEFHDGEGWAFWGYGAVGDPAKRVRVHINDQPANCWK